MKHASTYKLKLINNTAKIIKFFKGFPFEKIYGGYGQILMFHRVLPKSKKQRIWSNSYLEVTPEFLNNTILYFKKKNYQFISLDELAYILGNKIIPKRKFVVFTFDDGFKDNLVYAYPIFKKHKVPFTIYITTSFPDYKACLWWNILEKLVVDNNEIKFTFKDNSYSFNCNNLKNKEVSFERIHRFIKNIEVDELKPFFENLFRKYDKESYIKSVVLNWNEINQLASSEIVTIGAHSISHNSLLKLDDKQSFFEISESKKIIENKIASEINHFSYPFGSLNDFSKREIKYCSNLNFTTATSTISSNIVKKYYNNPLSLPRIAVGMSMTEATFDLIRYGIIPMIRNKGKI